MTTIPDSLGASMFSYRFSIYFTVPKVEESEQIKIDKPWALFYEENKYNSEFRPVAPYGSGDLDDASAVYQEVVASQKVDRLDLNVPKSWSQEDIVKAYEWADKHVNDPQIVIS